MFSFVFGKKSQVDGESTSESGLEATERPADETCDDFVLLKDNTPQHIAGHNPPPPYHTLPGANAFHLPYGVNPPGIGNHPASQHSDSSVDMSTQSMINDIPYKFGSDVRIEGNTAAPELTNLERLVEKINNFDWDSYDYNFKLERDVLEEYSTKLQCHLMNGDEAEVSE